MTRRLLSLLFSLSLSFSLALGAFQPAAAQEAPATAFRLYLTAISLEGQAGSTAARPASGLPTLDVFAETVADGSTAVRGVYAGSILALPVIQQPADDWGYVSPQPGVVTQFGMASWYGVAGLLAHNYAAGQLFFDLKVGDDVYLVAGDGGRTHYRVSALLRYQALEPTSPASNFVDLETGQQFSAVDVFMRVYTGSPHLTFQTCIAANGEGSWGRLFVIAEPVP